jgi:formylglycine-generating enzyme required for sulfatase activity
MSATCPLDDESLPPNLVLHVDEQCDRFETALRQGQQPQIEQYLGSAPPAARAVLLHELVALELAWGRAASLPVYRQRFPDQAELLGRLFAVETPKEKSGAAKGLFSSPLPQPAIAIPVAHAQGAPRSSGPLPVADAQGAHAPRSPVPCALPVAIPVTSRASWRRLGLLLAGIAGVLLLGVVLGVTVRPGGPSRATQGADQSRRFTNTLGMEFALIPAGRFKMGSPETELDRRDDEGPQHDVTIAQPFFLGIHEVTVGQFRVFVEKSGYQTLPESSGQGAQGYDKATQTWPSDPARTWRNPGWPQSDRDPVVCVTWQDARAFCEWLSLQENRTYRLPTEAEWEYACRAGTTTPFAFGASLSSFQANFNGEFPYGADAGRGPYQERPVSVGSYQPNPFGIHDMHGNVTEWCADGYQDYGAAPQTDPHGPLSSEYRVHRGGSWFHQGQLARAAMRGKKWPDVAFSFLGFRVACKP